jgi:hypothetical protein
VSNSESAAHGAPSPEQTADLAPIQAPVFFGSSFQAFVAASDVLITMSSPRPAVLKSTGAPALWALQQPVCTWQMSIQTAKDLALLLNDLVKRYEVERGEIRTEFTQRLSEPKGE